MRISIEGKKEIVRKECKRALQRDRKRECVCVCVVERLQVRERETEFKLSHTVSLRTICFSVKSV